jgi:hypothetical protein
MLRSCAGAVTHHPLATTRHPPLPSSASSGPGDTWRHGRRPHGSRWRSSPAQRVASRGREGERRWVIRWAEPCRTGPYQAQRRARRASMTLPCLQVFRRVDALRTPCFTRERSQVRNPPRPSSELPANWVLLDPLEDLDSGPVGARNGPLGHSLGLSPELAGRRRWLSEASRSPLARRLAQRSRLASDAPRARPAAATACVRRGAVSASGNSLGSAHRDGRRHRRTCGGGACRRGRESSAAPVAGG